MLLRNALSRKFDFFTYFSYVLLIFFFVLGSSAHVFWSAVLCSFSSMQLLYLDSLDVDEHMPAMVPRVSIWNTDLIAKVIKKDQKRQGEFGKLRVSFFRLFAQLIFCLPLRSHFLNHLVIEAFFSLQNVRQSSKLM